MCLGIPMKVIELGQGTAAVELDGAKRTVSTALLEKLSVGEYVIVHAGFAIQVLDEKEAKETIRMIRAITEGEA
jgi:hydrogenase expression/formation protein HypC